MSTGTVITFYSYKGGVGRTLTLANVGALLAQWGYRVLCIDWDLEAPGLHLYFKRWLDAAGRQGLTELLQAYADQHNPRWEEAVTNIPLPEAPHPLALITAGRQDESYVRRVQALEWSRLYEKHNLGGFLEELRNQWKEHYDFVLVDSRTGITDIGGICTVQLPDQLVILFTANEQSLFGSVDVCTRATEMRNRLPYDRSRLLTLPIATRFETRVEYAIAQHWLHVFARKLDPIFAEWAPETVSAHDLLNFTRTPYVPFWSFGEKLPVIDEGTKDPESLGFALETVTAILAQGFAGTDVLVKNRDSFVETARRGRTIERSGLPMRKQPIRVFFSYSHRDRPLVDELLLHLSPLVQEGLIEDWSERIIPPGSGWREAIDAHLQQAEVVVLLVSADFLASDYIRSSEMSLVLERQRRAEVLVVPVLVRPVDLTGPLSEFQMLPSGARPVTTWKNRDEAWANVTRELRRVLSTWNARRQDHDTRA
jgi:cellulose biosynthesis protein BcsQ